MMSKRFVAARPVSCLLVVSCAVSAYGAETTRVHFKMLDVATGKITPAMVCITDVNDKEVRLPPDGRVLEKFATVEDFVNGIRFKDDRNWIGPVRAMKGKGDNNNNRSFVYELRPSIPYWTAPVMYMTSGDFVIDLPAGRWRVAVARGMEYLPVFQDFAVSGGGELEKSIELERWVNLPERGWWSGDVHVHHPTFDPAMREFLLEYATAEDVHVVNTLEMGHHGGTHFPQQGFGKKYRVQRDEYVLVSGQEDPRSTFGHIIGINLESMVRDPKTYDFYDITFRGIHEQPGGLVGFAHFAWNGCDLPRGFPWFVTTGELDFVEALQFGLVNLMDYAEYLNLGFRLTAAAGSDIPWGSTLGEVRTFVHTGPKFDPDAWFRGLKKGHTFVSNGPVLDFTVNGQIPGSEIKLDSGKPLKVIARATGHARIGLPKSLTVMGKEGVVKEESNEAGRPELFIELELTPAESTWLMASTVCHNGAVAHTTPVYVVVDDQPTWNAQLGPQIIDKQLKSMSKIQAEMEKEVAEKGKNERNQGVLERLEKARKFYADLRAKMGG